MHNPEVTYPSVFGIDQNPAQWKAAFDQANRDLPGELKAAFEPAWQKAVELSFPTIKVEKWRWLDFSPVGLSEAQVWTQQQLAIAVEHYVAGDDDLKQAQALPEAVVISSFREALQQHPVLINRLLQKLEKPSSEKFQTLAEALGREGLFVYVPRGVKVDGVTIARLRGAIDPGMSVLRSLIWLEPEAELSFVLDMQIESSGEEKPIFQLAKTDLIVEDDARLRFTDLSNFGPEVVDLCYSQARIGRSSKLTWIHSVGATGLGKQSLEVDLLGEGSEAEVGGVYFPAEGQRISVDTFQNHKAPNTKSNLLFRGAAIGNGEAIWRGMIYVDPIAQKTDGYQANQNLMLGERAEIKSIPGLEICADDVSCSHGATVGRIDEDELFYLAARGIPLVEAEQLIVQGFFDEIIERIDDEQTRNELSERLLTKFEAR